MGECTCLDCRKLSTTWVCDDCQKVRDSKDKQKGEKAGKAKRRNLINSSMNINDFLSKIDENFLMKCFIELEDFRENGVLIEGEIRKLNNQFFNSNPTTLFTIGELVYREISKRHFS